ncbi:unnamed protein product [Rhizophagus irregularis]|uniref:Uncharacterized protein n=1 Tax=Rhizophagus irregularis TaxID=588596 RepID=A0A915ZVE1_9GLOM|nr:unnamed protein product [Rhizophagus irregularis]
MISSTSTRDNNNKRKNDNDIKNTKKTKKDIYNITKDFDIFDEFSTFKSALLVDLHKTERTPFGKPTSIIEIVTNNNFGYLSDRQASVEAILNTPSYSLQSFLSVNEGERISMLKATINSLSAHVWHSINSLIKDSISQEVAQRCQLRFLVSMVQSYRTLDYFVH